MSARPSLASLSDDQLLHKLRKLVDQDQHLGAEMLHHLAEVDHRKLYLGEACSSMFVYCTEVLHMSEGCAYLRIGAARTARRFPVVFDMVANGQLHLSTLKLLGPHLREDNHRELLVAAVHRSKREVEQLVARSFPRPAVASSVRKLPLPRARSAESNQAQAPLLVASEPSCSTDPSTPSPAPPPVDLHRPGELQALSAEAFKISFTATKQLHDKLRQAQELLRHQIPDGDVAKVVERAMDELVSKLLRERFGVGAAKRRTRKNNGRSSLDKPSRYVAREVLGEVYERDEGQCTYVSAGGRRCSARGRLEIHHQLPFARGGPATADNLTLRCAAHNGFEAELDFGKDYVNRRNRKGTRPGTSSLPSPELGDSGET